MEKAIEDLKGLVDEVMGLDMDSLDENKDLSEVDEWDSFNNLMLVSKCEEHYGVKFSVKDIEDINTISKLKDLILRKVQEK